MTSACQYHRPTRMSEMGELLAHPDARPIAGGTDLLVQMRAGSTRPHHLVDLSALPSLDRIRPTADGGLEIGAMVRLSRLINDPRCAAFTALLGSDYPFPWESHPVHKAQQAKLTSEETSAVLKDNARRLFGLGSTAER